MVQYVKLVILKYVIGYFLLAHTSVAFGCKCESSSLAECCRSSNFTALFSDSTNVAYLNGLPKPFHIVTPFYFRKRQQLQISASEININISAINITSRVNDGCIAASVCAVKMAGKGRKKDIPCEVLFCESISAYNASFRMDSRQFVLTKLRCVNTVCGHVLASSSAQPSVSGSETTPRVSVIGMTNDSLVSEDEDTDMDSSVLGIGVTVGPRAKVEATTAGEATVLDTVWLVVILGGVALGVLMVVGIVFACFARRDRRRKAAPRRGGGLHSGSLPSPTSWNFRRTSAGSASVPLNTHTGTLPTPTLSGNPRFDAAVNEFYRAALTPDDDDDAASVSDDSMTDAELFGGRHASMHAARRHRRSVPRVEDAQEDEDGEEFERSSAQRTIKFSAAPTFVPSSRASSTSTHRVLVEAIVEPRPPSAGLSLSGSMPRTGSTTRGPNSTPLPVRSILKKGGSSKRSADVAVGTTQCTTPSQTLLYPGTVAPQQLPLADAANPAPPRRRGSASSSASTSSGYSLVECEDKSVGVTEAELDALASMPLTVGILSSATAPPPLPMQVPFGGLFVTSAGQLVTRDGQLVNAGQFVSTTGQLVTLAAPLLAPPAPHATTVAAAAAMQTSSHTAHSHSPSTNLSPVSVGSAAPSVPDAGLSAPTPQAARRAALSPHKVSADCESASVADSSECDCLSQSAASDRTAPSATGTASQNNDDKPSKLAACDAALDREIDAVSLSDLDLFNLARNFDTNLLGLGTPLFAPKLTGVGVGLSATQLPSAATPPSYLPNPARLNRLSSLASDSNNPSALNTPSPPTVAASTIGCQPKLELRDASLELNLNLNIAPASLRPTKAQTALPTFSRSRPETSVPRGGHSRVETDLDSEADCADIDAVGEIPHTVHGGVTVQHASGAPVWASTASANVNGQSALLGAGALWQGRQSWTKGAPDQFDFS